MALSYLDFFGCASIGVYALATDQMVLLPPQVPNDQVEQLREWLKAEVIGTRIGESVLIGALACANSTGIILPHFTRENEISAIKSVTDVNVTVMKTKRTAYGNLVLANDHGALVDPRMSKEDVKTIEDTLGVEANPGEIAGLPHVGSLATATNKGVLAHALLREDEEKLLKEMLKVHVDVGTVNCGIPYIATGLVGNKWGAVAGFVTSGPEMFIIGQALDLVTNNE